jgi:hypothetical protein
MGRLPQPSPDVAVKQPILNRLTIGELTVQFSMKTIELSTVLETHPIH